MKTITLNSLILSFFTFCCMIQLNAQSITYPIVDTGVHEFYSNTSLISLPVPGDDFFGQDAHYQGNEPSYTDNEDGTVTDNITGLMWQKDMGSRISYNDAKIKADTLSLAGYTDWRMPTIKELYSLIIFTGQVNGQNVITPFIDTNYFIQPEGSPRPIDAQTWSSTKYVSLTMVADSTVFGVNFLDGRIKGYPQYQPGSNNTSPNANLFVRMVRGNPNYGINDFIDNGDGTITDNATGLMWQKADDGVARDWQASLAYAENLSYAGYSDWRLPNTKELQSIVDYTRSPDTTQSPAIDELFSTTSINDPNGNPGQYPYFWTGTSHLDGVNPYSAAVYIAFGEAQGKMNGVLFDVHGAGAQRSDPKTGNPDDYPQFQGPQGDVRYVFNYTRCVRNNIPNHNDMEIDKSDLLNIFPNPFNPSTTIHFDLKNSGMVTIDIFNVKGQKIKTLIASTLNQGKHDIVWDGKDTYGASLASGVYYVRMNFADKTETKKLLLLK